MLRKLLKYDLKSVFKYWWIAAISSLVLSVSGGGCISILNSERELPAAMNVLAVIALFLVIFSYMAFSILSVILVFTRFYKNFFTDEGYLTFTLPVKRNQLLNSKLIMSTITMFCTGIMLIINVITMLCVGLADEIISIQFLRNIFNGIQVIYDELGLYLIIYIIELLILLILCIIFSNLFLFACITIASIITKRAKVITAIGIYYAANSVFSFVIQMFYIFGIASLASWLRNMPRGSEYFVIALVLFGIILFIALFCALLYALQYWMIDRKLNLS